MRLFIAIPIPDSVKKQLIELQQPIRNVRWQQEDKMHLTLHFLGETDKDRAKRVQEKLDQIEHSAFSLTIEGLGYFPEGGNPKVLWAGIKENKSLYELQKTVENSCTSLGFEAEDRPFKPHITLARMSRVSKDDIASLIDNHKDFRIADIPVKEFALYESQLDSDGAVYDKLKIFQLE